MKKTRFTLDEMGVILGKDIIGLNPELAEPKRLYFSIKNLFYRRRIFFEI